MSEGFLQARQISCAFCIDTVVAMLQVVELEYDELFGGEVEAVHVVYDMADLNKLCKEYTKLKDKLADLIDDYTSKKRRHKKIKPQKVQLLSCFPFWCQGHTAGRRLTVCLRGA